MTISTDVNVETIVAEIEMSDGAGQYHLAVAGGSVIYTHARSGEVGTTSR